MMLPPRTCSPPNFLSPSRCAFESRPFLDEPTPFLCAIALYLLYLDLCKTLTVALFAFVLLAAFLFENDDLVIFAVANDGGVNRGIAADLRVLTSANDKSVD